MLHSPRSGLSPLRYGLCHPLACASPLARLTGFWFVLFLYEGLAPLAIAMPPRHPAGLSSCRGEFPSVTPAGRSSPWAQPILHYERKRVLHSARRSGLHYEQREFFSTLRRTHAPLYVTCVLAHARCRAAGGVHILRGICVQGASPWLLYAAPQYAGLLSCRGRAAGNFYPLAKRAKLPAKQSSRWRKPSVPVHRRCTVP